jgi:GWxTD domain-containing protein
MRAVVGTLVTAIALVNATPSLASGQADPAVAVRAVRFFRPDAGQTRVKAFVQIPYAVMTPTVAASSGGGTLSYEVAVRITDSTGLTLHTDTWRNHADAALRGTDASAMEILEFQVAPGRFRLDVTVTDSVSGARYTGVTEVAGFADHPAVSDLLLSPAIRAATASDTVPQSGELGFGARGEILVTAATTLGLTPLRAVAHYLLEVYSEEEATGTLTVAVRDREGKTLVRTPAAPISVPKGGRVLTGQLDLEGLPPGAYDLAVETVVGGSTVERTAPFLMADLQSTLERDVARRQAERVTDEGYFAAMGKEELDDAFAPVFYVAEPADAIGTYGDLLSVDARRRYLTEFWQRRDPDPTTARNEAREGFYGAVDYANEHYRERGRAGRPGWRTDRGRIYARSGAPDEILQRLSSGKAPPYEVWRYTRQRNSYYVFADRTRLDSYVLLCSNDLKEQCRNDWREVLGEDAVRDIGQFLGIDFYSRQNRPLDF